MRRRLSNTAHRRGGRLSNEAVRGKPEEATPPGDFGFVVTPGLRDAYRTKVFPSFLDTRRPATAIRVWTPECSTGEDAYSIAMLLVDFLQENGATLPVQIFATDSREPAIRKARTGLFDERALAGLPGDYRERFFTRVDDGYRINKSIRELCIFAGHALGKDPPFARIDLIACRSAPDLLGLGDRIVRSFHYALQPTGYLMLEDPEVISGSTLFSVADRVHHIYAKAPMSDEPARASEAPAPEEHKFDPVREADRIISAEYGPPSVLIGESLEILQLRGDLIPYLRLAAGWKGGNLLDSVRPDIRGDVRAAVDLARRGTGPVRREVRSRKFALQILPIPILPHRGRVFLLLFEAVGPPPLSIEPGTRGQAEVARLRAELASSAKHLQIVMADWRASEEELRLANEELHTLNDELQARNTQLTELSSDLSNLLSSVHIPIVMLDKNLHLRRFTPLAGQILNLEPGDIGHSILSSSLHLIAPGLRQLLSEVTSNPAPRELEAQDSQGTWYLLRIRPYKGENHQIEGVVLALHDVDLLKRSLEHVRQAREFAEAIVETFPDPLMILDNDLRLMIANRAFYEGFHGRPENSERRLPREIIRGDWQAAELTETLRRTLARQRDFQDLEIEGSFAGIGHRIFSVEGRRLDLGSERSQALLVTMRDVTGSKLAEREMHAARSSLESSLRDNEADLRQNRAELQALAARLLTMQEEERRRVSRELHDDLNQKLAMLEMDADRLGQQMASSAEIGRQLQSLRSRVGEVSNDIRRVAYQLHPSILEHLGLAVALRSYCAEFSRREGIKVTFSSASDPESIPEDVSVCLYRIAQESLRNVAKHAAAKRAAVALEAAGDRIHLSIGDNGRGFDVPVARQKGSIGLLSMQERVRLVNGEITLNSKPGHGTQIDVWAPLGKDLS